MVNVKPIRAEANHGAAVAGLVEVTTCEGAPADDRAGSDG